jgi:hypothetical protein
MRYVQLAVGVAPVVPSFGDDDVVHVGVGEDDAGEGAPGAAQVERAGPRHPAVDEGEPRVLQHALPVLRRQRPVVQRDRVHVAVLDGASVHPSMAAPPPPRRRPGSYVRTSYSDSALPKMKSTDPWM